MVTNYKKMLRETMVTNPAFVRAVFSGGSGLLRKVIIRPVVLKGKHFVQFSYLDKKKDITKNYTSREAQTKLQQVLQQHFSNINLETTDRMLQIEVPKKGKVVMHEHLVGNGLKPFPTVHDKPKNYLLSPDQPVPFLKTVGIMTEDGKIKADKQHKFRQMNEFLRIIATSPLTLSPSPLHIVDFGCGSGYLTLAVYHYFTQIRQQPISLVGVDTNADVITKLSQETASLGWDAISFQEKRIITYQPEYPADIVIALHACDTATDEALAQAIRMESQYIFSAPCCHHHMQVQLEKATIPSLFHPVFRHQILGERLGDILTDTFRGLILQIMGYTTDIIEFVSPEHTAKNLLIKAVKVPNPRTSQYIHEYNNLKKYWKVTPYLETLLGTEFTSRMT